MVKKQPSRKTSNLPTAVVYPGGNGSGCWGFTEEELRPYLSKGEEGKDLRDALYQAFMSDPKRKVEFEALLDECVGPDTPKRKRLAEVFERKYPGFLALVGGVGGGFSKPPIHVLPWKHSLYFHINRKRIEFREDYRRNLFPSFPSKYPEDRNHKNTAQGRFLLVAVDLADGMTRIQEAFREVVRFYKQDVLREAGRLRKGNVVAALDAAASYTRKQREELLGTPTAVEQERRKRKTESAGAARTRRRGREALKKFGL